jgi:hypothetical protein
MGNTDITQVGMLLGAVATLGTVIGILWKQTLKHFGDVNESLDEAKIMLRECETDRIRIWQKLAENAVQIEDMRGSDDR